MNLEIRKEIELTLLRSVIDNPPRMDILLDYDEDIFYFDDHKKIFNIFDECTQNNFQIDPPLLYSKMTKAGFQEKQIIDFQLKIAKLFPTVNIYSLINDLEKQNNIDKVENMAKDLLAGIKSNELSHDAILEMIGDTYEDINGIFIDDQDVFIQELNKKPLDDIFKKTNFIRFGIPELDQFVTGMFNGQLITIAGRPGSGKSTLAMQIAINQKDPVYFLSREMPVRKLYARNLSYFSEIESWKIEFVKSQDYEKARILQARQEIENRGLNIYFNDKIKDYRKIIRRTKRIKNLRLIILDYLQLMKGAKAATRERYIADMTGDLKDYAKERDIPIIIISQLNRGMEYDDRMPTLADLRESGAIEQDSDVVIFIYCKKSKEIGIEDDYSFIVAKNRDGKVGVIKTYFEKRFYRFGYKIEQKETEEMF